MCTHCKKSGHDVSQCFEIHGYLEWYENRGNNARGGRSGRGRGVSRANATLTNKFTNKCGVSSSHLFSADQWNALTGLISGTKLNDDMQSSFHINSYMCAIQDQSREMIGTGVRRDGLYYFKGIDSVQHLTVNGYKWCVDLWHQRMGHPSEKVMKLLTSVGTAARSFNKACEKPSQAPQTSQTLNLIQSPHPSQPLNQSQTSHLSSTPKLNATLVILFQITRIRILR
nr:Retrovirus-related Pol polyprotein from transposon TNT 1-94 [Ipomoea batatas]